MNLVDTHTHLYDEQFADDRQKMIENALQAGVHKMYMPNCDSSTINEMLAIAAQYPENCFPMMGLHPCYVKENYLEELEIVEQELAKEKYCAVGEIGLDYYWDLTFKDQQAEAFCKQIDWAIQYDLPIIIHSRESLQECINIVKSRLNGRIKGIFHCFGGSVEEARQIEGLGMFVGIGGVLTFKNSNLAAVVKELPPEMIVLETDAPYLAPVPYRGKRNESAFLPLVAQKLADIKEMPLHELVAITTANANKVFGK